ncbi:PGRP1-like protein [Mya arenaria]|uniref:PGRP1-like protein n=1 Tax=Mya arenaria TaxID=6604 RepID=A0ABY7DFT3_MYAAR|nr:PGRP1-like protein [Mya arenaria]
MKLLLTLILLIEISVSLTLAADCACATTAVHVRNGAGTTHTILTTLAPGHCLTFKGHRQTVDSASWVNVDYNGQNGWIHEGYVTIKACSFSTSTSSAQLPGCPHIISRAGWGARAPTHPHTHLTHTPKYMFIHHGASGFCHTKAECTHMVGRTSVTVSWWVRTETFTKLGVGIPWGHTPICVIGDFTHRVPNDAALNAVKQLIQCGLDNHKLTSTYTLRGHRDMGQTACPGDKLYALIHGWPHY